MFMHATSMLLYIKIPCFDLYNLHYYKCIDLHDRVPLIKILVYKDLEREKNEIIRNYLYY